MQISRWSLVAQILSDFKIFLGLLLRVQHVKSLKMNDRIMSPPNIPGWIVWVQCICFSVLYAIWALPETILIRHICLIIGALLSLWTIYQNRHSFFHWRAIPVWLIVALFAWATCHLFFLANDFAAQYEEYTSIWKRTALGAIFALGFGIALSSFAQKSD